MSTIETLQEDLRANMSAARELNAASSVGDLAEHIKNTMWPFMEAVVEQVEELDGCVEDLLNQTEDILQPETGAQFVAVVQSALVLMGELKKRLGPGPDDQKVDAAVTEFFGNANDMIAMLQEITVPVVEDGDAEDQDADEAEDDEDDEDEE